MLTTLVVFGLTGLMFPDGPMSGTVQRLALGLLISIAGQFGDLSVSAIKRDVGVNDTGMLISGHGGVLDRANSLLFAARNRVPLYQLSRRHRRRPGDSVPDGRGVSYGPVELQAGDGSEAAAGSKLARSIRREPGLMSNVGHSTCHSLALAT